VIGYGKMNATAHFIFLQSARPPNNIGKKIGQSAAQDSTELQFQHLRCIIYSKAAHDGRMNAKLKNQLKCDTNQTKFNIWRFCD